MRCCLAILALCTSASALSAADYRFAPGPGVGYLSETKQEVSWESAGDKLTFTSAIATTQAWKCLAVEGGTARLEVAVVRVLAEQRGPGDQHRLDSANPDTTNDPLLGHLVALEGVPLTLLVEQTSGATRVSGGARIAAAIGKRAPNAIDPGGPSPLAQQAATVYGDANLSRIWSQTLALPSAQPQQVPVGEPLSGTLTRTWSGDAYRLAGTISGTTVLTQEPSRIAATVSDVSGDGATALGSDGWPQTCSGTLRFTLTIDAATQPVVQHHVVQWKLQRIAAEKQ